MQRLGSIALIAAIACFGTATEPARARQQPFDPLPVLVSQDGATVTGITQSYCVDSVPEPGSTVDSTECADMSAPTAPPRERLRMRARDPVVLIVRDNPRIVNEVDSVEVAVGRTDRNGFRPRTRVAATRVPGTPDRWTVRLPIRAHDDTLSVDVGFVSFLVGVRERRTR